MTKQTYPGKLDNLAAGGLVAGIIVKNDQGISTYEDEEGVFPESQFFKLRIGDGEVQDFYLYSMDKVNHSTFEHLQSCMIVLMSGP
ncbi:unnamed protein product [Coregonus sp. 'balchen']|nr:unnamed protein product [Coregonus sp. 'balchen']